MRDHLFKMLMNQEGGSPGGGAAPPAGSGTPNPAPPAQGGAPAAPSIDTAKLVGDIAKQVKDGVFAELRRSGVFKGGKDPEPGDGGGAGAGGDKSPPNATPGLSPADVQKLIARETAFERIATEHKLTEGQRKHVKAALDSASPEDVGGWAKTFLTDLGIVKAPPTANQSNNGGAQGAAPNRSPGISDGGAPTRDTSLNHEGQVWKMTKADVDALVKEKGFQAAAHELRARMKQDLRGTRIMFPRPGS